MTTPTPTTLADQIAALRAAQAKATPLPWAWRDSGSQQEIVHWLPGETWTNGEPAFNRVHSDGSVGGEYSPDIDVETDGAYIILAANLAPKLLDALEAMEAEAAALRQRVAELEGALQKLLDTQIYVDAPVIIRQDALWREAKNNARTVLSQAGEQGAEAKEGKPT